MTDPRAHPHARSFDGPRITYRCGCVNEISEPFGLLRSVSKCPAHLAERHATGTEGEAYYRGIGALDADAPERYMGELTEALGPLPTPGADILMAEVGCGVSPYVDAVRAAGWYYSGIDPSPWAVDEMERRHDCTVYRVKFDDLAPYPDEYGFVLAAHVVEHTDDAPGTIAAMAGMLRPGGHLWVIVPDDSDPLNPDHTHFFSQATLRACVEAAGLEVVRLSCFRRIERERFLYLSARKPA